MSATLTRATLADLARREQQRRRTMRESKAEAEEDFLAFVRMMWPVLEPEKPLIEGWLLDLLCLPYETEIETENGPMAVGLYVESGCSDRVLSFNHSTQVAEWANVANRQKSKGKPLVNISLCDRVLTVTEDHPVFVDGRGYVRAVDIVRGETVLRVHELRDGIPPASVQYEAQHVCPRVLQSALPLSASEQTGPSCQTPKLRNVWEGVFPCTEGDAVLQHDVLWAGSAAPRDKKVPEVQRSEKLGFGTVSAVRYGVTHHWYRKLVRLLWEGFVDNCRKAAQVLQLGLFRAGEPRREQRQFHPRGMDPEVPSRVLANAAANPSTGRTGVLPVPRQRTTQYSPHRQEGRSQRGMELGRPMHAVPSGATRSSGKVYTVVKSVVCAVERGVRIPASVYNLSVAGNHNYFAAGVLVHNCDTLMAITDGELTRVCINVPPGTAKSSLLNVLYPAWEWGPCNRPYLRYLSISYSTAVPVRDNLRFLQVIQHPRYQECWGDRVQIARDGAEWVSNTATGWKMVTSTGGGVTGFRGDRLLCFPADQLVWTAYGAVPIGNIVRERRRVPVWSMNTATGEVSLKPIIGWHENGPSNLLEVALDDGTRLTCTPDHRIWTRNRGWVQAQLLCTSDVLPGFPVTNVVDRVGADVEHFGQHTTPKRGRDDSAKVGDAVEPIISRDRSPLFVRQAGHAHLTFCLTVQDNHTFYCGSSQWMLCRNCDDLNNPMSVESDTVRNTTNRFVREIMPHRLNDLGRSAIINLQQRTHENDATATLIEHGQGYTFVCVPMEFDPLRIGQVVLRHDEDGNPEQTWIDPRALDETGKLLEGLTTNDRGEPMVRFGSPMARAEGESCWPERFPPDAVAALKTTMTDYSWSSQFNQIPGVRGGAIIKRDWWKLWRGEYPELGTVIVSLDTAVEEGETNDYNACTAWGAFPGEEGEPRLLLLDAWRERMTLAQLVERVAGTCRERRTDYLIIEHKTRGRDVHDEIVRLYQNATWETVLIKPAGDKVSRLKAVSHLFSGDFRRIPDGGQDEKGGPRLIEHWSGGMIYAPDRDFADLVISEVAAFPYGAHDDLVDTVSQALGFVRKNGVILRKVEYLEAELESQRYRKPPSVPYAIGRN